MDGQTTPETPTFSQAMRTRRVTLGLSQVNAAARAQISTSRWVQLEKGHFYGGGPTRPSPDTAAAIAYALGWDPAEALVLAGYPEGTPIPEPKGLSLAEQIDCLPARHRESVARIVEALLPSTQPSLETA